MHLKIKPWNIKSWGDSFGGIHPHHAWMDSGDKKHWELHIAVHCINSLWGISLHVLSICHPLLVPKIEFCDHYYVPQSECDFLVSRLLQTCWGSRLQFRKFGFGEKSWFQKIRSQKKVSVLISDNLAQKNLGFGKFGLGKNLGFQIVGLKNK